MNCETTSAHRLPADNLLRGRTSVNAVHGLAHPGTRNALKIRLAQYASRLLGVHSVPIGWAQQECIRCNLLIYNKNAFAFSYVHTDTLCLLILCGGKRSHLSVLERFTHGLFFTWISFSPFWRRVRMLDFLPLSLQFAYGANNDRALFLKSCALFCER